VPEVAVFVDIVLVVEVLDVVHALHMTGHASATLLPTASVSVPVYIRLQLTAGLHPAGSPLPWQRPVVVDVAVVLVLVLVAVAVVSVLDTSVSVVVVIVDCVVVVVPVVTEVVETKVAVVVLVSVECSQVPHITGHSTFTVCFEH
jgi:hypothetical protein